MRRRRAISWIEVSDAECRLNGHGSSPVPALATLCLASSPTAVAGARSLNHMNLALRLRVKPYSSYMPRPRVRPAQTPRADDGRGARSPARAPSAQRHLAQRSRGRAVVLHRRRRLPHPRADRRAAAGMGLHGKQDPAILAHGGSDTPKSLRGAAVRHEGDTVRSFICACSSGSAATAPSFRCDMAVYYTFRNGREQIARSSIPTIWCSRCWNVRWPLIVGGRGCSSTQPG